MAFDDEQFEPYDPTLDEDVELPEEELAAEEGDASHSLSLQPLFSTLFQRAVEALAPPDNPDQVDQVLHDYATYVVPHLSAQLAHHTAKGGDFAAQQAAAGIDTTRYQLDQSLRAHLINGLLPAIRIAHTLKHWGVARCKREFDETTYRLFCAGYTLHDWLKFPNSAAFLSEHGLSWDTVNVTSHLPIVETYFRRAIHDFGLDQFLAPLGNWEGYLHDIIAIASNTQKKHGTVHNLQTLSGLRSGGRQRNFATDLATLADYIVYLGKNPVDLVSNEGIQRLLRECFSDENLIPTLTYHAQSDLRGVLSNIINNAALAECSISEQRVPLLYTPTGVVYLTRTDAPPMPAAEQIATASIERIRELCQSVMRASLIGFGRAGKGLKYAPYYELLFSPAQLAMLICTVAQQRITDNNRAAAKRFDSILAKGMVPALPAGLPTTVEVDWIAESCALLVRVAATAAPKLDATDLLLRAMKLSHHSALVQSLNGHRAAGGVPYGWYVAAGLYRQAHPGLDAAAWGTRLEWLTQQVAAHLPPIFPTADAAWQTIHNYISDHLILHPAPPSATLTERLKTEIHRAQQARKSGRGATTVCSLCSSAYPIEEQREAAILFAPMVYSNKQPLHGSKAIRHICAVCSMEMMLRQLLMNRGRASGKNFEGRRIRYLSIYPTYFFTPETLMMLRGLHNQLRSLSFTSLRKALFPNLDNGSATFDLSPVTFQFLEPLLIDPHLLEQPERDWLVRLRYSDEEPVTFSMLGLPPSSRDAKDAEAWVLPAFYALLLPLLLDCKVVASESLLPIINDASELPETVLFDGAHPFVQLLVGGSRLNLDQAVRGLQRLTAAYLIHVDNNASSGAGSYNYHWNQLPTLTRNLATSSLYVFHYLKKGLRSSGLDTLPPQKAALYRALFDVIDRDPKGDSLMSDTHARTLTKLYRQFYRASKSNSNAILRPLSVATKALMSADPRIFSTDDALIECVEGELVNFMERVRKKGADGRFPKDSTPDTRAAAIADFSRYIVVDIYRNAFGGDISALQGKQLNLLKNACEVIYLDLDRQERLARGGMTAPDKDAAIDDEPELDDSEPETV